MADAAEIAEDATPAKPGASSDSSSELVGALALGGGGFYAVYAGLFDPSSVTGLFGGGGGHGDAMAAATESPPEALRACSATWRSWRWTRS